MLVVSGGASSFGVWFLAAFGCCCSDENPVFACEFLVCSPEIQTPACSFFLLLGIHNETSLLASISSRR